MLIHMTANALPTVRVLSQFRFSYKQVSQTATLRVNVYVVRLLRFSNFIPRTKCNIT